MSSRAPLTRTIIISAKFTREDMDVFSARDTSSKTQEHIRGQSSCPKDTNANQNLLHHRTPHLDDLVNVITGKPPTPLPQRDPIR